MNPDDRCQCGKVRLYAGQKPTEDGGFTHMPDECIPHVGALNFSCPTCHETYRILGIAPADHARALREWPGCCDTNHPGSDGGEAVATGEPDPSASAVWSTVPAEVRAGAAHGRAVIPQATVRRRLSAPARFALRGLLGPPAWVRRRIATWPFDAADFTT